MIKDNMKYIPYQVVWEMTLRCNLNCLHCGSAAGKARSTELSTKEGVQLIHDLAKIGSREVCFMGGEPLLRKDWYELAKEVKKLGMEFLIISNGFNINEEIMNKLATLDPYAIATSLDGGTAKTHDYIRGKKGSFDKVMEYISLSKERELPTSVITTVSKLNVDELPLIKDILVNRFIAWQIQVATPHGRFPKKYALSRKEFYEVGEYIASLQKKYSKKELPIIGAHGLGYHSKQIPCLGLYPEFRGCQAGITILSIRSNGNVTGCLGTQDEYIEGNIKERSIIDIWNDPKAFAYNRKFTKEQLGENCRECKYGEICKGGCLGMSLGLTGKPYNNSFCFHKIEEEGLV